jgi:hypothetical protein
VLLSSEVYDELYRVQIAEKRKVRRGLAGTMGTIVLDAVEAHAPRLATTWTTERYAVGEGSCLSGPRRMRCRDGDVRNRASNRRALGVTAANGQRLDNLVQAWGPAHAAPWWSRPCGMSSACYLHKSGLLAERAGAATVVVPGVWTIDGQVPAARYRGRCRGRGCSREQ